jgi:lycopene beta-cyclase
MLHYDYIFTGTGLAALLTVREMLQNPFYQDKRILLLDADAKKTNDRTWCFWDSKGWFASIQKQSWNTALFADAQFERRFNLAPYSYRMIRGLDFYQSVMEEIQTYPNIKFIQEKVIRYHELNNQCVVTTETGNYTSNYVINSIFTPEAVLAQKKFPLVHQHFVGWMVKTTSPVFTPDCVTFMDFSVPQNTNTRFMYVLPIAENEALVEFTLFSANLLQREAYEYEIKAYLDRLGVTDYTITETEQGNIPMTCYPFWKHNTERILHIGSAGGWTKASTGYTFKNAVKKSQSLAQFLTQNSDMRKFHRINRFWLYDLLLIDILFHKNEVGSSIFARMFRKGKVAPIFKFLDEESTLLEDLTIILRCPKRLFLKALWHRFLG